MLSLRNITKNYRMGDTTVEALRGVSVDFRSNEFVAVLGQSGCGKTTLLNIIGGLDRYTDGDLIINGVSTKKYRDRDWDTYRNHKIGFVFQSYNLIPHQNVLSNVELALTLSGVSKTERRRRAVEVLEKVGLKDQMKKRPNQMSGGQMQRVAIARALINDPDILLADEPTGALDSETSIQIMEILKEIAKDKLIIMVTHNPELAEEYSNRIIRLVDGRITGDSNPYTEEQQLKDRPEKVKKTSMSFPTALGLSLNNLMTKKGRTLLTAFAGSIGIIGIALILSLSNGVQEYINDIQHDTLASYPLRIDESTTDISSFLTASGGEYVDKENEAGTRSKDKIYTDDRMGDIFENMYAMTNTNDLKSFKAFLDGNAEIEKYTTNIEYSYGMTLTVYSKNDDEEIKQVNPNNVLDEIGFGSVSGMFDLRSQVSSSASGVNVFSELTENEDMFNTRYELVAGSMPVNMNEAVLIIDRNNEITDFTLYALGMKDPAALRTAVREMMQKKDINEIEKVEESRDYEYDEFIGKTFSVIPNTALYKKTDGKWEDMTDDPEFMADAYENGVQLRIVGIVREKETSSSISGTIGYKRELTEYVSGLINESEIVKDQKDREEYDVFSGLPFEDSEAGIKAKEDAKAEAEKKKQELEEMQQKLKDAAEQYKAKMEELEKQAAAIPDMQAIMSMMTPEQQAALSEMTEEERQQYIASMIPAMTGMAGMAGIAGLAGAAEDGDSAMPDMSSIIAMLPEDMQEMLSGMDDEQKMQFLSSLSGDETETSADITNAADSFDLSGMDLSNIDLSNISDEQMSYFMSMSDEQREQLMKTFGVNAASDIVSMSSQYDNLKKLGYVEMDTPSSIAIYPKDFEAKEHVVEIIKQYNSQRSEKEQITYTDIVGMLMSSVTDIVNAISYILIAFVAISLIVSSIMIGIITYISVLERTKEIGILRSIGASKKDISRVFNAETVIIGLISGAIGIGVTLLLLIPINIIIEAVTEISGLAVMPPLAGVILVAISVLLTLIAGLLPSRVAAKKDPVVALRTE